MTKRKMGSPEQAIRSTLGNDTVSLAQHVVLIDPDIRIVERVESTLQRNT